MLLATGAWGQRAVMEGVPASKFTIKIDTTNTRVDIGTTSYTGGIANVGLFVASNVVVGNLANKNACVIYSSGSLTCGGVTLSSSSNNNFSGNVVFNSSVTFNGGIFGNALFASSVTASAFFGDGSHLTGITGTTQFLSTTTFLGNNQTLGTVLHQCVSTATRTDWNGGHLLVEFTGGELQNNGANDKAKLSILVDGAYPTEINFASPNNALAGGNAQGSVLPASFSHLVRTAITAGQHSVCLVAWREAATSASLFCDSAASAHAPCTLNVTEIK